LRRTRYKIYEISAVRLLSLVQETKDGYRVYAEISELIKEHIAAETMQNDCPVFYQLLKILGNNSRLSSENVLSDVLFFMDFSGIYDRKPTGKVLEYQKKTDKMFNPEGLQLDFGNGERRFIAFERSASMSRSCRLSFIREDIYETLKERIMLGMTIGKCQLSKLYAYNGLMFTDGIRFDSIKLSEKEIIIVDNPVSIVKDVDIVTVTDDGTSGAIRKYSRVEKTADIEVLEFDGEGIISSDWAHSLDNYQEGHHSFQIRLPYIKGVVHEVDFKKLYSELGIAIITDIFGDEHNVSDVEMILTKSMFKGFNWMVENDLFWKEYLNRCRHYDHALYVSGMDKTNSQDSTELNYQFLNTLAFTEEEFRPVDLPAGWNISPETDSRNWITKITETAYYKAAADNDWRIHHFTDELEKNQRGMATIRRNAAMVLKKNALFINEKLFTDELDSIRENIALKYGSGQLMVSGDNRYLSDDLMRLLAHIAVKGKESQAVVQRLSNEFLHNNEIYAPGTCYGKQSVYTLLRSPHIARNEEVIAVPMKSTGILREKYLSHLTYVVMVDSRSLIPDRLGGADFDGDMVKTIADPLVNRCVMKNYKSGRYLPLLKIPAAEPIMADASDWHAKLDCIKNTFSSRIGQLSNVALNIGILAYDENTNETKKDKYRKAVEVLAILTGLEIDSAKSGVKPDLSEYLEQRKAPHSLFLKYNAIVKANDSERKWFQPTKNEKLKRLFASQDWQQKSSNLEKLPYYASRLVEGTELIKPTPQPDELLFSFATSSGWKDNLNPDVMKRMKTVIQIYETALQRVRAYKYRKTDMKRRSDVERILYSRGQNNLFSAEELYALFEYDDPDRIHEACQLLTDHHWHLVPPEERRSVYWKIIHHLRVAEDRYADLFCDFRNCGFRLLGDILFDIDESNRANFNGSLIKYDDCSDMKIMLAGVHGSQDYKLRISLNCLTVLQPINHRENFDFLEGARCAVALGKRRFAIEVLGVYLEKLIIPDKSKRKWRLFRR